MPQPIWPRHIVFAQTKFNDVTDTIYLVAHSVDHPKVSREDATHARGTVYMSVYSYKDNHDGTTSIRKITHINPNGYIPVTLINMYVGNMIDMFNRWKD